MNKIKIIVKKHVNTIRKITLVFVVAVFAFSGCSSPWTGEEEGTGAFTINLSGENNRAVSYPPAPEDIDKLRFVVKFTPYGASAGVVERTLQYRSARRVH